jgi:CubicO group peptidase (beta-lactamase class C family)
VLSTLNPFEGMLKFITVIPFLLHFTFFLEAQVADLASHVLVKDSIVSKFNRDDFKGIYELSDDAFRKYEKESDFIAFLKNVKQAGPFLSSELMEDLGDVKRFKVKMAKISIQLTLSVLSPAQFNIFAINRLFDYDTAYVKAISSDNFLKNPIDTAIDKSVRKYLENKNAAGLSIGVIKEGKIYTYNYGEAEKGTGRLPNSNTYYEIGSITKTFTGTILAQAVLEKKINLHDDIRKYLKDTFPNLQFKGQPIEVVHLANHTSGLPGIPDDFFKQTPYDSLNPYINYSKEMFWKALHRVVMDTIPGTIIDYSNYGVSLLGYILEEVYQKDFETMVKQFITDPMKMKETKFIMARKDLKRFAQGHNKDGKPTSHWDIVSFAAAGGIRSTVSDMIKYLDNNIKENSEAIRLAHQLTRGTYSNGSGLNWGLTQTQTGNIKYQHDGGTGGFRTSIVVIPQLKTGYIILTNSEIDISNLSRDIGYRLTKQ